MTEKTVVARPYAKAIFDYARQTNALPAWSVILSTIATVVKDKRVAALLIDPRRTSAELACFIIDVCAKVLNREAASNFIEIVADNRRLNVLPQIAELFEEYRAEQEKTLDITVTSAEPLSEKAKNNLSAALQKRFHKEITLHTQLDPSVLGGAVVRAGDYVLDGSLRGRLTRLAAELG